MLDWKGAVFISSGVSSQSRRITSGVSQAEKIERDSQNRHNPFAQKGLHKCNSKESESNSYNSNRKTEVAKKKEMKITVMTADEQIVTLDVDRDESVIYLSLPS